MTPAEFDRLARQLRKDFRSERLFSALGSESGRKCSACGSEWRGERFIGYDPRRQTPGICPRCFSAGRLFPDQTTGW